MVKALVGQVQLGNLAEWVAGIGTITAVGFSAVAIRSATKSTRATQADAAFDEAMKVTVVVGSAVEQVAPSALVVTVTNDGKRPIRDITAVLWMDDNGQRGARLGRFYKGDQVMGPHESSPISISPEQMKAIRGGPGPVTFLTFTDSNDVRWFLRGGRILQRMSPLVPRRWWHLRRRWHMYRWRKKDPGPD